MLLSPTEFEAVVNGERRGFKAGCLRGLFALAEMPYAAAVRWRNRRYDSGRAAIRRDAVPVVSVGNLTLGGTGKTPMVEWLARWFSRQGIQVGLVSRGYGAKPGFKNDEALELEQKLPGIPHVQNRDRVAATRELLAKSSCQVILLDDGFQHRRLHRDLDIVLLDALEPFGFEHVFPRGTLREPLSGLARAHSVVLSRADMVSADQRQQIRERVATIAPHACWVEATHAPQRLINIVGNAAGLESLHGKRLAAFCGLGNPAGFQHTLQSCGYDVAGLKEFPDHHNYTREDVESIAALAKQLNTDALLCTHKDLVKLAVDQIGGKPLWALAIELQILQGQAELESKLHPLLPAVP